MLIEVVGVAREDTPEAAEILLVHRLEHVVLREHAGAVDTRALWIGGARTGGADGRCIQRVAHGVMVCGGEWRMARWCVRGHLVRREED